MKHKFYDADNNKNHIKIYFTTDTDGALIESKAVVCGITGNRSEDFVEYVFDFSENKHWSGNITKIRVDPMDCGGSFEIDYIRFVIDKSMLEAAQKAEAERAEAAKKDEEERLAKGIIVANGDAENPHLGNAFFGAGESVKRILDGENYVWMVSAPANNAWTYIRQKVKYVPGATYTVKADIKVLGNANDANKGTGICCNTIYNDDSGKTDHVVFQKNIEAGKWTTVELSFKVSEKAKPQSSDQFCFYSNPAKSLGVSFLVDNIIVQGNPVTASPENAEEKEEPVGETIEALPENPDNLLKNGSAESMEQPGAFFGAGTAVAIASDGENKVWMVSAPANKSWNYIRQNITFVPGATYTVRADVKALGTANDANKSGAICCNTIYIGADGKKDHVVFQKALETGKWTTIEFEFEIPENTSDRSADQFAFYSNPVGDYGVSYMMDNIVLEKK